MLLDVGDEVKLRNGEIIVITYIEGDEIEGFNKKGWMKRPYRKNVVEKTGRHFQLPIEENKV